MRLLSPPAINPSTLFQRKVYDIYEAISTYIFAYIRRKKKAHPSTRLVHEGHYFYAKQWHSHGDEMRMETIHASLQWLISLYVHILCLDLTRSSTFLPPPLTSPEFRPFFLLIFSTSNTIIHFHPYIRRYTTTFLFIPFHTSLFEQHSRARLA